MMSRLFQLRFWRVSIVTLLLIVTQSILVRANASISAADVPMLALKSAPGLVMLTMSRDHQFFYGAYTDTSDLNDDGVTDIGFKPNINYYGNFVSNRCYEYVTSGANKPLFRPLALADANGCKTSATSLGMSQLWHGNWLNWAATSRMDVMRRVLYGGFRVVDNASTSGLPSYTSTVLQGSYIPKDSHVWGKEFRPGRDIYDITQYTTLAVPASGKQHLFVVVSPTTYSAATFPSTTVAPVLRYITDADQTTERIWYWASADIAQGIGSSSANFVKGGGRNSVAATDLKLKVEACVPIPAIGGAREVGCTGYPSSAPTVWKPTGVLHDYSNNDSLKFGLLTGSYEKNYSGGVVRRNIQSFKNEIDPATGRFGAIDSSGVFSVANTGIARTIDLIAVNGWSGSSYDCSPDSTYQNGRQRYEGACNSWGAPIAEMMYEGLRFFSGKSSATPAYDISGVSGSQDSVMGLSNPPAWQNPFQSKATSATYGNPICSKPIQMVIADPITSFDSDQLPGTYFPVNTSFGAALGSNDLAGLSVSLEADAIWSAESLGTRSVFIGESGSNADGNPTAKSANSFSQLRGHAPDQTQFQGSFYSAGVARFGQSTGVPIGAPPTVPTVNNKAVGTIAVALGSLTPRIEFANPNGGTVSIVPISKATANASGATAALQAAKYQATGAITGFYYADYTSTAVSVVVNFSDSEQGTDNETDAQVQYDISISGSNLTIKTKQLDPNPGGIQADIGYVISGTGTASADGLYLETRSCKDASCSSPVIYYLDTLAGQVPKTSSSALNATTLPAYGAQTTRVFALSNSSATAGGYVPHNTLWYAAKYGGAGVMNTKGDPTNYFKATNPADLPAQMGKAFRSAAALAAVASTSVVGVGQRSAGTAAIYQSSYDSLTWSSRLYAFSVGTSGVASNTASWDASQLIGAPSIRNLYLGRGGTTTPVALTATGTNWSSTSLTSSEQAGFGDFDQYKYLLGDKTYEERKAVTGHAEYRSRGTTAGADFGSVLGDVVNSDPQIVTKKDYGYTVDPSYTGFVNSIAYETLAVSANDGFFHVFDASLTSGAELFAFMPRAASVDIRDLTDTAYSHRYFLDGPTAVGHAKIPVNTDATTNWRSVLIGTGGLGAKTVFAVDASSKTFTAASVLWEMDVASLGSSNGDKLGHVVGRPQIGKLANGTWVAIVANGYNSTNDKAYLFVVNLQTGAVLKVFDTNVTTGNGLTSIAIARKTSGDTDAIDYVYGADYLGNIWRFDVNATPGTYGATALIYSSSASRNITAEIAVGAPPAAVSGGVMIYFGTGRYLTATDAGATSVNALYGVHDNQLWSSATTAYISSDADLNSGGITMTSAVADTRSTTMPSTSWWLITGKKGWVVPLTGTNVQAGERVIAQPVRYTQAGKVDAFLFTSIVPGTDECLAGLDTWVTAIDALTGAPALAFKNLTANAVKVVGGSPRGVFVLSETKSPTLYISQTVFSTSSAPTSSYGTIAGGSQTVCVNGVCGQTRVLGIELTPGSVTSTPVNRRQVWRQLK